MDLYRETVGRPSVEPTSQELNDEKYIILKDYFLKKGLEDKAYIQENDLWFHEYMMKTNPDNFLHLIFTKTANPQTNKLMVRNYIVEIVHTLNEIYGRIVKLKMLEEDLEEKSKTYQEALELYIINKQLNEREEDFDHQGQKFSFTQDTISVSYAATERNSFRTLNDKHPLLYKAGLTPNVLIINTFGLKGINNKEVEIATKNLPIEEIYTAHPPKVFTYKIIPAIYLIIPYETDSSAVETKEVEMKFELNYTFELRVKILRQLILQNETHRLKVVHKRDEATLRLQHMLEPFETVLKYKPDEGVVKNRKGSRACDGCSLF